MSSKETENQKIKELCEALNNAIQNSTSFEDDLIDLSLKTTVEQRMDISDTYETLYKNSLISDLKKRLSGDLEPAMVGFWLNPADYDCYQIYKASHGYTYEPEIIFEIFSNRPYDLLQLIRKNYPILYGISIEDELARVVKGDILRNALILLNTERRVNNEPDHEIAKEDAMTLNKTPVKEWCSNEDIFTRIFAVKSPEEIVLMARYYFLLAKKILINTVESRMFGEMRHLFREILFNVVNPHELYASKLKKATRGLNSNNNMLERILIARSEIDMHLIREYYEKLFQISLTEDIIADTTGFYRKFCLELSEKIGYKEKNAYDIKTPDDIKLS